MNVVCLANDVNRMWHATYGDVALVSPLLGQVTFCYVITVRKFVDIISSPPLLPHTVKVEGQNLNYTP